MLWSVSVDRLHQKKSIFKIKKYICISTFYAAFGSVARGERVSVCFELLLELRLWRNANTSINITCILHYVLCWGKVSDETRNPHA